MAPVASTISAGLVALTSACLTGIGLTMRGMHKDALKNAAMWAGLRKAYQDPNLDEETAQSMNQIVLDMMRIGKRDEQQFKLPQRQSSKTPDGV